MASVAVVLMLVLRFVARTPSAALSLRKYHILPLSFTMATVGWVAAWMAAPSSLNLAKVNGSGALARIETIEFNEKSMAMQVKLLNNVDAKSRNTFFDIHILLSTRGCDYNLRAGDMITLSLDLEEIDNLGNPDEMDFAGYLFRKGLRYRQHCDVKDIELFGSSPTLMTWAFNLRQQLQHKIMGTSMSPSTQSIIIAMLLGNSDFISHDMRDLYSQAGVAHVLALSGLHVAIITFMIWFLLFPLDYLRARKLRLVVTLIILIAYDVFTGLSPSVVRATVMLAFVFMSVIFYRKSTSLNSLFAAALVILIFSPSSLYGAGFQLSFITVAALIIFYKSYNVKYPDNKLLRYLYTTLLTSLVAMVSTIILTAYYFNTLSFASAISNLAIMPLLPVFMSLCAVAILFVAMGTDVIVLDRILDFLSSLMNSAISWFAASPLSSDNVYVTWVAVLVYYAALLALALWFYKKKAAFLITAGLFLVVGLSHALYVDMTTARKGLVIFNSYNSTPIFYFCNNKALLWVPDVESDFDMQAFRRRHRAFLAHYRIDSIVLVDSTAQQLPGAVVKPPCAHMQGFGMITAGRGRWKHYTRPDSSGTRFDVAIITKGFHSDLHTLKSLIDCDRIILSGGIYRDDLINLNKECEQRRIPFYNIKKKGAFIKMGERDD